MQLNPVTTNNYQGSPIIKGIYAIDSSDITAISNAVKVDSKYRIESITHSADVKWARIIPFNVECISKSEPFTSPHGLQYKNSIEFSRDNLSEAIISALQSMVNLGLCILFTDVYDNWFLLGTKDFPARLQNQSGSDAVLNGPGHNLVFFAEGPDPIYAYTGVFFNPSDDVNYLSTNP